MLIKKIIITNHPIFGDITLDLSHNKSIWKNIVFVGDNGTGKTSLLELINNPFIKNDCELEIEYEISKNELEKFIHSGKSSNAIDRRNYSSSYAYNAAKIRNNESNLNGKKDDITKSLESNPNIAIPLDSATFTLKKIIDTKLKHTTFKLTHLNETHEISNTNIIHSLLLHSESQYVFQNKNSSLMATSSIATKVQDILSSSNERSKIRLNEFFDAEGRFPKEGELIEETSRFKNAFEYMFNNITFSVLKNEISFKKYNKEIPLNSLSDGEKQIIIRGASIINAISANCNTILIDEPELNMHPKWQRKVLDFYKKLLSDNLESRKESQLFIATHSLEVLNSIDFSTDLVLIFKRDEVGKLIVKVGKENNLNTYANAAFDCSMANLLQETIILVEGSADVGLINKTIRAYGLQSRSLMVSQIHNIKSVNKDQNGSSHMDVFHKWLKNNSISKNKIVFLYDHATKKEDNIDGNLYVTSFKEINNANTYFPSDKFGIESLLILPPSFNINDVEDVRGRIIKKRVSGWVNKLPDQEAKKVLLNIKNKLDEIEKFINSESKLS